MRNLIVISNDKLFFFKRGISSKFNDTLNILDALQKKFQILLISRKAFTLDNFTLKKSNIYKFSFKNFSLLRKKKINIFMISVTPFNILYYLLLNLLYGKINGFIYLRSDGYKEYKIKFGIFGPIFFSFMMKIVEKNLKVISVNKYIKTNKRNYLITPSELDQKWFKKIKLTKLDFPRLLYLGRFKKEKGVYSLIELFQNSKFKFKLTIAGGEDNLLKKAKNINFIKELSNQRKIINLYDNHNIFILPSFTEGSPKVILESLVRKKPIIVFEDIKHVKSNFKGIFISKRDPINLKRTINRILKNYSKIQKEMNKNMLTTKKDFQKKLINIVDE